VRQGEKRLNSLEDTLKQEVIENVTNTEEELEQRIDNIAELMSDNREFMETLEDDIEEVDDKAENETEKLKNRVRKIDKNFDSRLERLRSRLRGLEKEMDTKDELKESEIGRLEDQISALRNDFEDKMEQVRTGEVHETLERQAELPFPVEESGHSQQVNELEERVDEVENDRMESIERKLDNLAEHVISNQEKLHELETKMRANELESQGKSSEDITIVS
jgi:chromosome segregation ATPase